MKPWTPAVGLILYAVANPLQATELAISIDGVRNAKGNVMIAVYDGEAGFRDPTQAIARISLRARASMLKVTLPDLTPMIYAVAVFHDENGNSTLDTNLLGIPTEGYGYSNDARGTFGPPSFKDSAIEAGSGRVPVLVTLGY